MSNNKEKLILNYLRNSHWGSTPKEIALYTKINQDTVKGILRKLAHEGKVRLYNNLRGYYEIVEKEDHGIFDFKFQNCVLTVDILGYDKNLEPITNNLDSILKTRLSLCKNTHRATMHISSDYCMELPAFLTVANNFIYAIKLYTGLDVSLKDISISTIEFNKDYFNFRLDGPNCITLSSLIAQYKLYQKKNCVREEYKVLVPMPFTILNQLLTKTSLHADLMSEMEKNNLEIAEIKKSFRSLGTYLSWIIGGKPLSSFKDKNLQNLTK